MTIVYQHLGLINYTRAWELQDKHARLLREGSGPETILLCEHPPTFTLGKNGRRENILLSDEQLDEKKITVVRINRGGDVTLHNPGQLVLYPILDLRQHGLSIPQYVNILEECIILVLEEIGIIAQRRPGYPGVWVNKTKIASIGINVSKGITTHGLALNVNNDLSLFLGIIPCGISGCVMTSVSSILATPYPLDILRNKLLQHLSELLGISKASIFNSTR